MVGGNRYISVMGFSELEIVQKNGAANSTAVTTAIAYNRNLLIRFFHT
jgi:hypothetical protein